WMQQQVIKDCRAEAARRCDVVRMLPALAWREVQPFFAGAAATVISSTEPETFCHTAAEALSVGTPVVAFDIGNVPVLFGPAARVGGPGGGRAGRGGGVGGLVAGPGPPPPRRRARGGAGGGAGRRGGAPRVAGPPRRGPGPPIDRRNVSSRGRCARPRRPSTD